VSSEGQFLVGELEDKRLHVYSADYSHMMSINLCDDDTLGNAVWTPRGHIMYAAYNTEKVVVMTRTGEVIAQTKNPAGLRFYVSPEDVIYLASFDRDVYQSTDDGATWTHVFEVADCSYCLQVIKVSSDSNTQTFWALECKVDDDGNEKGNGSDDEDSDENIDDDDDDDDDDNQSGNDDESNGNDDEDTDNNNERDDNDKDNIAWRLRIYIVDKRRASNNITWRDINIPSHVTVDLNYAKLAYDGHTNVFVASPCGKAVHVWSVSGQYVCELLSSQQFENNNAAFVSVATDPRGNHMIYVGQTKGKVGVFELEYKPL
jgi:hypothetical protein